MSLINIEKTITLDVYDHDTTPSVIKTIQLDTGTRTVFAMIQNSRQDYDIGQNATVSLTVLRPDKTKVQITGQPYISHTGTDGTMYGAKADLSDVALAVKGNLKAQFKITSGEQELRTEIFAINNGEALDAGDGDWAGDLDGHNLDEMAEDIEDAKAAVSEMETDVSELKSGFTELDGRVEDLEEGGAGGGLSKTAVNLLNTILSEAVYGTDQTANIALLKKELSNVAPVSISAVLDGTALAGQSYSELSFTVTATFDDDSTAVVDKYTVITTGTVKVGSNTVTIKYRGVTTTCTFTAQSVTTYGITYNLTNAASSNNASVVIENSRYTTEISTDSDHYISTFTVTMGGVDVTATVRNGNNIVIDEVTGNVVITVVANAYVYLDPLIIKRPYTNEGDSTTRLYTDEYATQATRATINYIHIGKVTEYPAKYDCTLNWTITNTSDSAVDLGGLGFGLIKDTDEYINNNAIAYWQKIDNTSHSLEPNESISGTYQMKAGWQLILTTVVANTTALTERIRGDYVAEDFSDYTNVNNFVNGDVKVKDPYKARTFYSDGGTTAIKTMSGNLFEYESAGKVGPFVRDAVVNMIPIDISGRDSIGANYTAFVNALSDENIYYAQAVSLNVRCSNLWRHITLTATASDMYWVFGRQINQNYTTTIKAKEVSA